MLTENDVEMLLEIPEIKEAVEELYRLFIQKESDLSSIELHDFFSGLLLAPSLAMVTVDGSTDLLEELSLNKKARRLSKGGYFLQQDPVVRMVNHLQNKFGIWESKFFESIGQILSKVVPEMAVPVPSNGLGSPLFITMMNSSYILIKLLETFFLGEGEAFTAKHRIRSVEYQKMKDIADQLHLSKTPLFPKFLETFEIE